MNERIQELAEQAEREVYPVTVLYKDEGSPRLNAQFEQKFAELIVHQMFDITDAHTEVFQTDRDKALIEHIKQSVKTHFGVEE